MYFFGRSAPRTQVRGRGERGDSSYAIVGCGDRKSQRAAKAESGERDAGLAFGDSIKDGGKAALTLDEYPGRSFEGTIARNSNAIDQSTRTLNVEVDVDNPKGELLPGAYVFVHFKVPDHVAALMVPSNTLLFRAQGLQVGVVRNGRVQLVPVKIGKDAGATVEIASGLTANDAVILDPSDSLASGQQVEIANRGNTPAAETKAGSK